MKYNTKQKDMILDVIRKEKKEFTIKDIYNSLDGAAGLTTIYRLVDKLVIDGILHKHISKDNITYYEYLEECDKENHFYLKCEKCGNMIHVDCDFVEELENHITNEHKFKLDKKMIIINGICNKCMRKD